jgi:sec-independent protein translocase protein TatA
VLPVGPVELSIILVIALLLIGPGKLPETGRAIGRGLRELRDGMNGRDELEQTSQPPSEIGDVAQPTK